MGKTENEIESTVRFAKYIEEKHKAFLEVVATKRAEVIDDSPYADFEPIEYEEAFFGAGYTISSFPSLYDMYGKFMAGLDIEVLYTQILDNSINNTAINNRVKSYAEELDYELETVSYPKIAAEVRDINSVMSSTYIIARSLMENKKISEITKYDTTLRQAMLPVATERWINHLKWNNDVITMYIQLAKFYFSVGVDIGGYNYETRMRHKLWPFTVLDYERAALGALTGATKTTQGTGVNRTTTAIGSVLGTGSMGYMVGASATSAAWGGPVGAALGGLVGLGAALL